MDKMIFYIFKAQGISPEVIHLVRTLIFRKTNIFYSQIRTRMENFAYVLNGENGENYRRKFLEELMLLVRPKDCITNKLV